MRTFDQQSQLTEAKVCLTACLPSDNSNASNCFLISSETSVAALDQPVHFLSTCLSRWSPGHFPVFVLTEASAPACRWGDGHCRVEEVEFQS